MSIVPFILLFCLSLASTGKFEGTARFEKIGRMISPTTYLDVTLSYDVQELADSTDKLLFETQMWRYNLTDKLESLPKRHWAVMKALKMTWLATYSWNFDQKLPSWRSQPQTS